MRVDCAQVKNGWATEKIWMVGHLYSCIHEKIVDYLDNCPLALVTQVISQVFIGVRQETMWKATGPF